MQFNEMSNRHTEGLRRLLKNIQDSKGRPEVLEAALETYDDALNALMPFLMAQCQIYWDIQNYHMVQRILRQSEEFCQENPVWQLNMAHAYFLMARARHPHCADRHAPARCGGFGMHVAQVVFSFVRVGLLCLRTSE